MSIIGLSPSSWQTTGGAVRAGTGTAAIRSFTRFANRLDTVDHEIEPSDGNHDLLPFEDLAVPEPIDSAPPASARWLAFVAILLGGGLGAVVGYGVGDLMGGSSTWAAVGALVGGLTGAAGVGVVANLTLRAMNEWHAVDHPEAAGKAGRGGRRDQAAARQWSRRARS